MREYKLGKKEEDWLAIATKPETQRENQSTEILFIEQAYHFLKEGGYLGIVIPDGILTNSSLQYVRNQIEDWFRVVAVISIPQTAFTATGAGEKSSVLFLRKWTKKETEKITQQKTTLQEAIKKENKELTGRIGKLYEEGREKDPEVFRDNIRLSPEKIRTVVGYLQKINLGETDLDAKGRAFETFMDSFFRGNFGQYFTPRPIVKFTTDVLPITN
jgi:type I restriction enzyme M protein